MATKTLRRTYLAIAIACALDMPPLAFAHSCALAALDRYVDGVVGMGEPR